MRITADVIDIDEEIAAECSAPNEVQAQASSGAIPKQFGKVKINDPSQMRDCVCLGFTKGDNKQTLHRIQHTIKVPAFREIPRKKFDEKLRKINGTEIKNIKISECPEDNEEKILKNTSIMDEDEFIAELQGENLENLWSPFPLDKKAEKAIAELEKMRVKHMESLNTIQKRDKLAKDRIAALDGLRQDLKQRTLQLHQQMQQTEAGSAENCEDSWKNQGNSFLDFESMKELEAEFAEDHDSSKKKQWDSLLDDKTDEDADTGLTKYDKLLEERDRQIINFYMERGQLSTRLSKYYTMMTDTTDTSNSETDEETWTPGLLIQSRQAESGQKNECTEQKKEKTEEPHLVHPLAKHAETGHTNPIEFMKCRKENVEDTWLPLSVPKEHVCRAFKRSESVNEKKEKTDEQYMASPMKRRKPGGLLKHAMKRRFEKQRNHDWCIHRHSGARSYESPFQCRHQALKMREMCKKFSDLKLTENDFKENIIKSFDHMYMHYMAKSKMDEVKANNPKAKINEETPPQWMVEFLLKMKQEIKDEIMEELSNLPRIEMQGHSASGGKGDENQYQGDVIHPGIFCDNCDQLIHGIRYKCGNCTDFDLCQECESLPNIHNKNHIFLKIRYPVALKLYQKQKWQPFVLPNPGELFPSSNKSHQPKKLYEAKFVRDETVPDGTVLSPSTRFVKSWRVLNSGKRVWTHSTKLQHIQGSAGLTPASEQVDVPHLRPGEEGIVSVLFTTPSVPGVYRSHWNFCHKSRPFGHIVWCHIVVKDLGPEEKRAENTGETLQLPDEKGQEVASIAEVLTAVKEEHERGNMIPRKLAVKSHTATPNNTPFDLTPPKSPDHQAVSELKEIAEDKESVNSKQNMDFDPEDEVSVVSLSSSESDTEFVVIPMPKCFNLSESFSSQNIPPLSQYLQSDVAGDQTDLKSEHKLVKPRKIFTKRATNTETVSQETGVPELSAHSEAKKEMKEKESEEKILISHNVSADGSSSEISIIESGESSPMEENVTPKISSIHIAVTSDMNLNTDVNCTVTDDKGNVQQVEETEKEEPVTDIPASATFPKFPVEGITSIYEPASSNTEERTVQVLPERLVTAPLNAAATIYKTARDVISSFQHQGNAHARNNRDVGTSGTVSSAQLNAMEQLIEMGFCNRQKNEELLKKHKNDVALVVAELVSLNDNDWYAYRHVPATPPTYFD